VTIGPPSGVRSPWRFTVAGQLGLAHPSFLPFHTVPTIFSHTAVVSNARSVSVGGATVRVNAGPTALSVGAGVGISTPVTLHTVAPHALPRANIAPHAGVPLAQRPWAGRVAATPVRTSIPIGPQHPGAAQPIYNRPVYQPRPGYAPPAYHPVTPPRSYAPQYTPPQTYGRTAPAYHYAPPAPAYHYAPPAPAYHYAPAQTYRPSYSAPSYHSSYSAPSYHYSAPTPSYHYSAPSTSYSRPSTSSSYSRPSGSSGGHFGGRR
jgi:hypothetical protein